MTKKIKRWFILEKGEGIIEPILCIDPRPTKFIRGGIEIKIKGKTKNEGTLLTDIHKDQNSYTLPPKIKEKDIEYIKLK